MPNNGLTAIELQGLTKRFDEVVAVDNFNVGIRKGEFFSLLGPSGCGKTTTLRVIAGLETPTEGRVLLENQDVTKIPAYKRNVNTVFQDYALFPHMNVKKNIFFPMKMKKVKMDDAEPRIQKVLRLVNMEGFETRLPQQLSGGQRQRIALARSLVNEPAALLLDEPLGALDFKLRVAMQKVLKDIQRNVGITFVYVTHDQTEAMTMSDRIAVMKDGLVHQIGSPDEIYNDPASAFVASFIGDMNFLNGRVLSIGEKEGKAEISGNSVRTRKPKTVLNKGDEILLCIRSERVLLNPGKYKPDNVIESRLKRVVFRGVDYEATCEFNGSGIRAVIGTTSWDHSLKEGDVVRVGFNSGDVIVFPGFEEKDVIKYSVEAV
ncbi:MAG: ABC transporter ATP-binding protein [Spirochaetes bacterium]|nr:ABC transporter ATP-binding protein [Spirochaetota bacterium]